MLEHETEILIGAATARSIGNAPSVTIKDILASEIPPPLKTFFRTDAELTLLDEFQEYSKRSKFNYGHPEVQTHLSHMISTLVLNYSVERKDYLKRVDDATHLLINYLVRPQWTLSGVLFEKDPTITAASLVKVLRYFSPYEYLRELITAYLRDRRIEVLTATEFNAIIRKADGEFIRRKTGEELSRVLTPLFDFFDYPDRTGTVALPVQVIHKYFGDKSAAGLVQWLKEESPAEMESFTQKDLASLLERYRASRGNFEIGIETRSVPVAGPDLPEAPVSNADGMASETPVTEPSSSDATESSFPSVSELVPENDRRKFVKRIFKHDESAYESAVSALEGIRTWKEASVHIDEIFIQNDIDPYSTEAMRFTQIIQQRYFNRG